MNTPLEELFGTVCEGHEPPGSTGADHRLGGLTSITRTGDATRTSDDALALDLRKPQDYFHRVWSTAFRAADLADAGTEENSEYSDTCTTEDTGPEQDVA